MKIYEFMQPHSTNEALGTALRGIGSVAAQAINKNLGTNIGGVAAGARAAPGDEKTAALAVNQGLAKQLSQEQSGLWSQALQAAMKRANTTYIAQLDANELTKIAQDMINRTLDRTGYDSYQSIKNFTKDPALKSQAQALETSITSLVTKLIKTTLSPTIGSSELSKETNKIWNDLAQQIAQTQNFLTFNRDQLRGGSGAATVGAAANPQLQAAMKATGINSQTLAKLNAVIRQSGEKINVTTTGSPTVDALLKQAKLI